jgi:hypothetical protein
MFPDLRFSKTWSLARTGKLRLHFSHTMIIIILLKEEGIIVNVSYTVFVIEDTR